MRQWKYQTEAGDEGKSLEEILRAAGFSKKEISRQKFIPDGITLDGEKCRVNAFVRPGQTVALNFQEKERASDSGQGGFGDFPKWALYEDDSILIVNKPSGLACHPGRGHYSDNLGAFALAWFREKGEEFPIRQIGRLDKDTSGIVVFAKDQVSAARLWNQRNRGELAKTYYGAVHGRLPQQEGLISTCMCKVPGEKNKMQICTAGAKAVTLYRVTEERVFEGETVSIVECSLKTGRTHQIRVHMAGLGNPILGDPIYGVRDKVPRLCLHAGKVRLTHPFTGEPIEVEADADFMDLQGFLRERMRSDGTGADNFSY